jgi:catechol 2,3-dioxygenase-like lactoylglutathione lyase family enzyme
MPTITARHYIALTVRDADARAKWCCDRLGLEIVMHGDADDRRSWIMVDTPTAKTPFGSVIVFPDPDNILCEFGLQAG